jgi:hypothetical protein
MNVQVFPIHGNFSLIRVKLSVPTLANPCVFNGDFRLGVAPVVHIRNVEGDSDGGA